MTDLAKLRELLEKATKDALKCNDSECSYNGQVCRSCTCYTEKQNHMLNARSLLIDEAPALLDEVEKLRAALRTCMNGCEAAINKLETPTTPLPAYHAAVKQARQALGETK